MEEKKNRRTTKVCIKIEVAVWHLLSLDIQADYGFVKPLMKPGYNTQDNHDRPNPNGIMIHSSRT